MALIFINDLQRRLALTCPTFYRRVRKADHGSWRRPWLLDSRGQTSPSLVDRLKKTKGVRYAYQYIFFYLPFASSFASTTGTLLEVITETASPGTESTKKYRRLAINRAMVFKLLVYQRQTHDCLFFVDLSNGCFSVGQQQCRILAKEGY
jgi:hypothetical protein